MPGSARRGSAQALACDRLLTVSAKPAFLSETITSAICACMQPNLSMSASQLEQGEH
jgi:hypothetical protein